jgi:ribosome-associated protein
MKHTFELDTPFIELSKLLKFLQLVESGGHAKVVITEGRVRVNGQKELRVRNKLKVGDEIIFAHHSIKVVAPEQ